MKIVEPMLHIGLLKGHFLETETVFLRNQTKKPKPKTKKEMMFPQMKNSD